MSCMVRQDSSSEAHTLRTGAHHRDATRTWNPIKKLCGVTTATAHTFAPRLTEVSSCVRTQLKPNSMVAPPFGWLHARPLSVIDWEAPSRLMMNAVQSSSDRR